MQVQLYGFFSDYLSFARVSRAIAFALRRQVMLNVHEIGTVEPRYVDCPFSIACDSQAPIGIAVTYPPAAPGWLMGHETKILVTVCESDRIPPRWAQCANLMTLVVVPSEWCKKAFERSGVRVPILVVPHGVSGHTGQPWDLPNDKLIRLLHVSGALSFPQRKGTPQLLLAFRRIVKQYQQEDVRLYLKIPKTESMQEAVQKLELDSYVHFLPDRPSDPVQMAALLSKIDAVIQPSRGEGFGLIPLEARCVGTPAILTNATGHAQHFASECDVEVATGPSTPLKTQGNEEGSCPTVSVEAIEAALEQFLVEPAQWQKKTLQWASKHRHEWHWDVVLKPLTDYVIKRKPGKRALVPGEEDSVRGL